jgi:uncharacterized protein YkwD
MVCRGLGLVIVLAACGTPPPKAAASGEPPAVTPVQPTAPASKGDFADDMLALHNQFRADHCAPPLAWSDELAAVAQKWADTLDARGCAFEHNRTRFGENLAGGTGQTLKPRTVVEMWYREVRLYDFARGGFDMKTGHFTQLVWAATQRVGCGRTRCKTGMDLVVCNYDPAGNVETLYRQNVKPLCTKDRR